MTRTWLLLLGALAAVTFASAVLVFVPQVVLVGVDAPAGLEAYTDQELQGRQVYIDNGCFYCHSQQVRDPTFTTDVDRGWGPRATAPADYVHDAPHLLGTMRTGPDLVNVGRRLPDPTWHLIHLYDPRAVVPWSIMPAFPYLFQVKDSTALDPADRVVPVPGGHGPGRGRAVVTTAKVEALVAYLLALDRTYPLDGPAVASPADHAEAAP